MRLFWCVLLCHFTLLPKAGLALSEAEICAKMMQDFGFEAGDCIDNEAPSAPVSQNSELNLETLESHVFFDGGGAALGNDAQLKVAALGAILNIPLFQITCIQLIGHSDSSGAASANRALGMKRAEAVAERLRALLEKPERVRSVMSAGETQPLASLASTDPMNRRVEIRAKTCP